MRRPISDSRDSARCAFTLVELLIVIGVIGILIALLIPAVQMARSAARKTQCANQLKQMGVAMTDYEGAHQKYPPGFVWPDRTLWQSFILPNIEYNHLYQSLKFGMPFDNGANETACGVQIKIFQCPAALDLEPRDIEGIDGRQPSTYLACASGTAVRETGPSPLVGDLNADGCFFNNSAIRHSDIRDGLSATIMIGESLFLADVLGIDQEGDDQFVDHWYIGSTDNLPAKNASEALGSTAVPINAHTMDSLDIEQKELAFSSNHFSGAQFVFMDGHVEWLSRSIDTTIYSSMGTRYGQEIASGEY